MMYNYNDIKHLHLEISSLCNAQCPQCPRNLFGYKHNFGYVEKNMTLEEAKIIFPESFIKQLEIVLINGNFGDCVMNPETPDIVEWFREINPYMRIEISTNGGARDKEFWQRLAYSNCYVHFCIDGLEDTHSIYRRNTVYETVLNNAKIFIEAGGRAIWKYIPFKHNEHQIDEARELSQQLDFVSFVRVDQGRNQGPIIGSDATVVGYLGEPEDYYSDPGFVQNVMNQEPVQKPIEDEIKNIKCEVEHQRSVYVDSTGDVYPCCYLGFAPRTYRGMRTQESLNLIPLLGNNNALANSLEDCMQWFTNVTNSWDKDWENNRCLTCNNVCGQDGFVDKIMWEYE